MKKFLFATFMGALVALVGCQQDDELTGVENTLGKKVSVTANIKANAQSRVVMEYNDEGDEPIIKVDWKESGESFKMYDATDETKVTTFTQTSDNQFEGTLPSESGSYYAVYGDDANLANQDGTLKEDYVWMTADPVTDLTQPIQFEHKTTVLKPDFRIDGEPVNASITQIVMDGVPSSNGTITITPSQEDDIFIFLPASNGNIEEGTTFNFTVTADGKEYVAELSISKSMEVGQFYTATIELEEIPYVTFTADAYQKLKYTGNDLQYSLDGTTFVDLEANAEIEFSEDGKLYLRGVNNLDGNSYEVMGYTFGHSISFTEEAHVACTGDIRTLIDYATYKTVDTSEAIFHKLFENCAQLTSAPELPATTLAEYCYSEMFSDCTSLTEAPELPATTLAEACYQGMFYGCDELVTAPALPATTLASTCYMQMFYSCDKLVNAPVLPATTLAPSCYSQMFDYCKALKTAPALPATTLAPNCYYQMFAMCSALQTAPALPATTLASTCYKQMFMSCTSLEVAPELPAEKLVEGCYELMFSNCTSLKEIKMLATDISASNCLNKWVNAVATTGEFTKASTMTTLPDGENGIPSGWNVKNQ